MPQRQRNEHRRKARTGDELPQQRTDADEQPNGSLTGTDTGGSALVAHTLSTTNSVPDNRETPATPATLPTWLVTLSSSKLVRGIFSDVLAVLFAVADVWALFPHKAQTYNIVLSFVACSAMLIRRKWPFLALLVALPGFLAGWATVAAMISLGHLARRSPRHWLTW